LLKEARINKLYRRRRGWRRRRRRRRTVVGTIVGYVLLRRLWRIVLLNGLLQRLLDGLLRVCAWLHILVLLIEVVSGGIRIGVGISILRKLARGYLRGDLPLDMLAIVGMPRGDRASKCHRIERSRDNDSFPS
jgi:hypothetical protein